MLFLSNVIAKVKINTFFLDAETTQIYHVKLNLKIYQAYFSSQIPAT